MNQLKRVSLSFVVIVLTLFAFQISMAQNSEEDLVNTKLSKKKLEEEIERNKVENYKDLPGGIFNAPIIQKKIDQIVKRFQNSGLVDKSFRFQVMLASTPEINGWVSQAHNITDIKLYNVVITKGLLDFVSNAEWVRKEYGAEYAERLNAKGEGLLAAVLAHEFGHVVNGDLEKTITSTRVYGELNADSFGTKLLSKSGYDPELMVELLNAFGALHENPNLRQLIAGMLDEHPKARFRVANIADLVETLKRRDSARAEFGMEKEKIPSVPNKPLNRYPEVESTSRTSVEGVERSLNSEKYKVLDYREKLNFLKSYFAMKNTDEDFMARQSVVRVLVEFGELLKTAQNFESVKMLNNALNDFEKSVPRAKVSSDQESGNVKLHLKKIKRDITNRQIEIIKQAHPEGLTLANLEYWAQHMDAREATGLLIGEVHRAKSVDDLKKILFSTQDNNFSFQEKFKRKGENISTLKFYESITRRVLELTGGDLEKTLEFIATNFVVEKSKVNGSIFHTMVNAEGVFSTIVRYVFENENIKFGNIEKTLSAPQTASEKVLSELIHTYKGETSERWRTLRNESPKGSPADTEFSYGSGLNYSYTKNITQNHAMLAQRFLDKETRDILFRDILSAKYNLGQTFDLVIAQSQDKEFWTKLKQQMTSKRESKTGKDLVTQINSISSYIQTEKITASAAVLSELNDIKTKNVGIHSQRVVDTMKVIGSSPSHKAMEGGELKEQTSSYPEQAIQNIANIPAEKRVELFKTMVDSHNKKELLRVAPEFLKIRRDLEEGIKELESEGRVTESATKEFLETYDKMASIAKGVIENQTPINEEFYRLQRRLRIMVNILTIKNIDLGSKVSSKVYQNLIDMAGFSRITEERRSRPIIVKLLSNDPARTREYLKNPTPENEKRVAIDTARDLARLIAHYEGLGSFEEISAFGINAERMIAGNVYYPAVSNQSKAAYRPYFASDIFMSPEEQDTLLSLTKGFEETLAKSLEKSGSSFDKGNLITKLLSDLWALPLYKATVEADPIKSLAYSLSFANTRSTEEHVNRLYFTLLTKSLAQVQTKDQMEVWTSLFALFMEGYHDFGKINVADMINASPNELFKLTPYRYRELFFEHLAKKIDHHDTWTGQKTKGQTITNKFFTNVVIYLYDKLTRYEVGPNSHKPPLIFRIWLLKDTVFPVLIKQEWYTKPIQKMRRKLAEIYTKTLVARGENPGKISQETFFEKVKENTVWAKAFDEATAEYIRNGEFEKEKWWKSVDDRERALELLTLIRSLTIRTEVYKSILEKYGSLQMGWFTRLKNYWKLYLAFKDAENIWTKPVLTQLENSNSLIEAWKIKEKAWEDHVKKRASEKNVNKAEADQLLLNLYQAKKAVDSPDAAEVAKIFIEGSRHRDPFIEKQSKSRNTTFEQAKMQESFKSYNTETPYHKIAKAFFELMDEYVTKLEPRERADMALYVSGVSEKLMPTTEEKVKKYFKGRSNRQRAISQTGAYLTLTDMRTFFRETDPEEKLIALRGLLGSGIIGDKTAEAYIIDPVLLADQNMPPYLRKLLNIYLNVLNNNEKAIFVSWLLANYGSEPMKGPQIVKLLVEKGGVVAAKMAQLIASHGFNLPSEYQDILEKFKGDAQKIDKLEAMKWIKERLAPEHFAQIKSVGRQLGSGSFKIGYMVNLKDGKKVVIMLPREYVLEKTMREFEIATKLLEEVQKDPELRRENLNVIEKEVQRIIREEMKISNEYIYMKQHKAAYDDRPILVKLFGNDVKVMIPQPIEGWSNDKILVEQYVQAKGWGDLPDKALYGWSRKDLAKAAINEVLNQLLSYMNPNELAPRDGRVTIDIDPHEENQIAKSNKLGGKSAMVNIDLGQSVSVKPEVVRGLIQMVALIYAKQFNEAIEKSKMYMDYQNEAELTKFKDSLNKNKAAYSDPFEILTKTIEEVEMDGITLKGEYLFFQKLFATLVGLKKHVEDPNYIMSQAKKILFLRAVSNPSMFKEEVKTGVQEYKNLKAQDAAVRAKASAPTKPTVGGSCQNFFN